MAIDDAMSAHEDRQDTRGAVWTCSLTASDPAALRTFASPAELVAAAGEELEQRHITGAQDRVTIALTEAEVALLDDVSRDTLNSVVRDGRPVRLIAEVHTHAIGGPEGTMNENEREASAVHVIDQAIGQINAKLDGYRADAAAALPTLGYEATVGNMHSFLVGYARTHPDTVAALAAVAIVNLARPTTDLENGDADA